MKHSKKYLNRILVDNGTSKYSIFGRLGKGHGKERSKTFPGIAKTIALQYGQFLIDNL